MRAYIDIITEANTTVDLLRRLRFTAMSLRTLLKSANPNPDERRRLYTELQQQVTAAKKMAAAGSNSAQLISTINSILRNSGLLPAAQPAPAEPTVPATSAAAGTKSPMRRADDDPQAPTAPATTKPQTGGAWRIVRLASKTADGTRSTLGIAEVHGEFVVFNGAVGEKYNVSQSGNREAAERQFELTKRSGYEEISPGHYPVVRGGTLPDLSSFGRRNDPFPLPKHSMAW